MKLARQGFNIATRVAFTQYRPQLLKKMFIGCTFVGLSFQQILRMQNFQSTVVSDVNEFTCVLVLEITETNSALQKETLKSLKAIPNYVVKSDSELNPVSVGVGFQTKYWERLTKSPQNDYETRNGAHGQMPKGKGNVIVHIKAQTRSLAYETVQKVIQSLPQGSYQVVSEKYGYQYKDGRDLSGFLDGTMNPNIEQQRKNVALNAEGGSYLIHQIWHHKLDWLAKQPEDQQEKMIGRKKENSLELRPLAPDSHVARTRSPDNKRLLIVRQSQPFGTVTGEHGLLFLAYSQNLNNFNTMLDRMTGKGDGINDSIMKMSTNTYGNYFYVPSLEELQKL